MKSESDLLTAPYPRPSLAWYVVGTLFFAWVIAYLDRQIITLMVPLLKADLALSDTEVSLIQGIAFSLFFALAGIPIGRLVDRSNRRNIIVAGVALWSVATALCGFASTFGQLFAARVAVGVGEACLAPAAFSLVADYFHPSKRGRAMGIVVAGSAAGNACSLVVGGLVLSWVATGQLSRVPLLSGMDARQITFLLISLPGILLSAMLFTIPEPARREVVRTSSGVSLVGYLKSHPGAFALIFCAFGFNFLAGYANAVWGPIVFMRIHGMSPGEVGIVAGITAFFAGMVAAPLSGTISDFVLRKNPRYGRLGLAVYTFPVSLVCAFSYLFADGFWPLLFGFAAISAATNFIGPLSYAVLQDMVPNQLRGLVVGAFVTFANLIGLGLAPTLVALITDFVLKDENRVATSIFLVDCFAFIGAIACTWFARERYRRIRDETMRAIGQERNA